MLKRRQKSIQYKCPRKHFVYTNKQIVISKVTNNDSVLDIVSLLRVEERPADCCVSNTNTLSSRIRSAKQNIATAMLMSCLCTYGPRRRELHVTEQPCYRLFRLNGSHSLVSLHVISFVLFFVSLLSLLSKLFKLFLKNVFPTFLPYL